MELGEDSLLQCQPQGVGVLSGVILVIPTSLSSGCPALISASSGACPRVAAHFHSMPVGVHFTGKETEADALEGETGAWGREWPRGMVRLVPHPVCHSLET